MEIKADGGRLKNNPDLLIKAEQDLLQWIEMIFLVLCGGVLLFMLLFDKGGANRTGNYTLLVAVEMGILTISHYIFRKGHFFGSARLLVLAGVVGPWGSALIDPSITRGNFFPLAYLIIPILFSSFFLPPVFTIIVGTIQIIGLAIFFNAENIPLVSSAASLFFLIVFTLAFSLIFNYQTRNYRRMIHSQMKKLNEMAIHDPLTSLYNRRFLGEFLKTELARLKRSSGVLTMVLFDIDNFKTYNDTFGHDCGDHILTGISGILTENFRASDFICRYGGDEFLIAMSGAGIDEAGLRCENLQAIIAARALSCAVQAKGDVTISIGIAAFPENGKTPAELIKAADKALYEAKEMGKNRIVIRSAIQSS